MSSGVSLPVNRPMGRALVVGQPALRAAPIRSLTEWGFTCAGVDEPYDAMVQLCRRPLFYSAIVLSLNSLYREELHIIDSVKRRFSHIDVWLTDTDGRHAALAEAMRLGADGLLADDGLQRIALPAGSASCASALAANAKLALDGQSSSSQGNDAGAEGNQQNADTAGNGTGAETGGVDPLLTAEELRALLQEAPGPNPG